MSVGITFGKLWSIYETGFGEIEADISIALFIRIGDPVR